MIIPIHMRIIPATNNTKPSEAAPPAPNSLTRPTKNSIIPITTPMTAGTNSGIPKTVPIKVITPTIASTTTGT